MRFCKYYKIRTVFTTRADFFTLYKLKEIAVAIADGFSTSPVFSALAGWKIHKGCKLPSMYHLLEMLPGLPLLHAAGYTTKQQMIDAYNSDLVLTLSEYQAWYAPKQTTTGESTVQTETTTTTIP